ncbi:MAG: ferritin-like domain-containing protein [Ktedonobacteraceae bacterium]
MKMHDEKDLDTATANVVDLLSVRRSRRNLLKGAALAGGGVVALSTAALLLPKGVIHAAGAADTEGSETSAKGIFSIAATAERLAVTFYSHGVANASKLGLSGASLAAIQAALVEEQIHELFFVANGGVPITSTFSFPHADDTFESLALFIATQQQLEGVFDSAFIAAVKEFCYLGLPRVAQIACQIAMIESEHRALGRYIAEQAGLSGFGPPADNWAFAPALLESVSDAPAVVAAAGYLSPKAGNTFTYQQVSTADAGVIYRTPFTVGEDND